MPLCNKRLTKAMADFLFDMPLDRACEKNPAYQLKVQVYDTKCSGCGFARIEVRHNERDKGHDLITNDIMKAIHYATVTGFDIIRTCEYPGDVEEVFGKIYYPSIHDIVTNTCEFWYPDRFPSEDGEFIEIDFDDFIKQQEKKVNELSLTNIERVSQE